MLAAGARAVSLKEGGGGVFEITVNGELRWSKRKTGRFPTDSEIDGLLAVVE